MRCLAKPVNGKSAVVPRNTARLDASTCRDAQGMKSACGEQQGSTLRRLAKAIYGHIPAPLRVILGPLVYCYRVCEEIRPTFWVAERDRRDDGAPVAVLCVAGTWDRSFVLGEILGDEYRERRVGRTWLWNLPKVWAEAGTKCCAAVVRVRPGFRRLLGSAKWLRIPAWVDGEVDLPLSPQVLASGNVKKDLRKIRKHELAYEVTRDIEKFDDFYHHMFVPHIARAHGRGARIWPREFVLEHFENGELLLVNKDGQSIAGGVVSYARAVPLLALMGVRDGNREFVRDGAIGARYHFTFRHLVEKGYSKVALGRSRAFLDNGVLRYKKKLGLRLTEPTEGYFYLRVPRDSEASRSLLKNSPLIFENRGLLYGAVFIDARDEALSDEDFRRLAREYHYEGLSRVVLVPLKASDPVATVPSELADRMSVSNAREVLGWR